MITGSAPIDKEVLDFLKVFTCCPIWEGYALTESTAAGTATFSNDPESGHIGGVSRGLEMKLKDVPDMGYFSTDKDQ